jgi:hypothetical protein
VTFGFVVFELQFKISSGFLLFNNSQDYTGQVYTYLPIRIRRHQKRNSESKSYILNIVSITTVLLDDYKSMLPCDQIKKNQSRRKWWFEPIEASE